MSNSTVGLLRADLKITVFCIGWALLALSLFVLGSLLGSPGWASIGGSVVKVGAFLMATVLCWRNSRQTDILSGRVVWQAIALGLLFYTLGDITVILWRSLWGIVSGVALAGVFYGVAYLFLAIGLIQAVMPRRVNLNLAQTLGIATAGVLGILLASWLNFYTPLPSETTAILYDAGIHSEIAPAVVSSDAKQAAAGGVERGRANPPELIQTIETRLTPINRHMGLVYVAGDCILLVISAAMLVAFWGGQYSETWKLVALASLCLYVADMFLLYQVGRGHYQQGSYWEVFWVLSALCFGLSASIERRVSIKMNERSPQRRWL